MSKKNRSSANTKENGKKFRKLANGSSQHRREINELQRSVYENVGEITMGTIELARNSLQDREYDSDRLSKIKAALSAASLLERFYMNNKRLEMYDLNRRDRLLNLQDDNPDEQPPSPEKAPRTRKKSEEASKKAKTSKKLTPTRRLALRRRRAEQKAREKQKNCQTMEHKEAVTRVTHKVDQSRSHRPSQKSMIFHSRRINSSSQPPQIEEGKHGAALSAHNRASSLSDTDKNKNPVIVPFRKKFPMENSTQSITTEFSSDKQSDIELHKASNVERRILSETKTLNQKIDEHVTEEERLSNDKLSNVTESIEKQTL